MAEQLSIKGLKDTLKSDLMMTDSQLQGHLTDLSQRVEELHYAPERQDEARRLLSYVSFELTARAVSAIEGLSNEGRHKYVATVLGNTATEGFDVPSAQFETVS
ncbi:MAG: hypothetical protein WBO35_03940 [Candidatus Saccharimonadales bacterium]